MTEAQHQFSQEELVQYLRDKGLSLDVLHRLKAFPGKTGVDAGGADYESSSVPRTRARKKKTRGAIRDPRRDRKARGLPPLQQNWAGGQKVGSSKGKRKKHGKMIKSYSESRIDHPEKHGMRKRKRAKSQVKVKKSKKNKKKGASSGVNRLHAGKKAGGVTLGDEEADTLETLGNLLGKEKQAQVKNYYRKRAIVATKRKVPNVDDSDLPMGAQRIQHGEGGKNLPGRNEDGTVVQIPSPASRRPGQLSPLNHPSGGGSSLAADLDQPPQMASGVAGAPAAAVKAKKSPKKRIPPRPAGLGASLGDEPTEKVILAEPPTDEEITNRIASMPAVLEHSNGMELNQFLTSTDLGLGEMSKAQDFVRDCSINALITIPNPPIRISLVPAPETSDITDWREGCHTVRIRHDSVYSASIPSTTKIPVSTKDWAKVLPDRRHPPCMGTGATSVLQLFVPREQSSHTTFLSGMKLSTQESDLVRKAATIAVGDKVVKNLGGGGVHQTIEQPPPGATQWDSAMRMKQEAADSALRKTASGDLEQAENPEMDPTDVASKVMSDLMNSKVAKEKGLDKMINSMAPDGGEPKMPSGAAEKFLSEVTDIIIHQIQSRLGMAEGALDEQHAFGIEEEKQNHAPQVPQQVTGAVMTGTMPTQQDQRREIHGVPGEMGRPRADPGMQQHMPDARQGGANPQSTHFQQDINQGARKNDTTVGTALLSAKMAGLMARDPGVLPATASVDPYNASAANSVLNPNTGYAGPGSVTQAQAPGYHQAPMTMQGNVNAYGQQLSNPAPMMIGQVPPPQAMGHPQQPPMGGMYPPGAQGMMPQQPQMGGMMNPMMMMQQMMMMHKMMEKFSWSGGGGGDLKMSPDMDRGGGGGMMENYRDDDNQSATSTARRKPKEDISQGASARSRASQGGEQAGLTRSQIRDLFTKALNNRYKQVEELFAMGIPPDTRDEHGNTTLHVAAQNGNKRLIKAALRWGAEINIQNKQGQTPLHYLFAYKYEELAAYLISKGSDDTIQNQFGYTCYDGLRPEED